MSETGKAVQATFKSKDTEEWLDVHFTRKVGYVLALFFNRLGVHPNVVTVISIFLGVGAGLCWLNSQLGWTVAGILLLMTANFLDSTDGQMARMTGKKTLWGRLLDGFAGDTWFISIYICIFLRLHNQPMPFWDGRPWGIWLAMLECVSGFGLHIGQAALADYYRNIYLLFHGDNSELNDSRELAAQQAATPWRERWFWKVWLFAYQNYTRSQERMTPCFQAFRSKLAQADAMYFPSPLGQEFCRRTYPLLKWTNILTFNTRAIALYILLLAGVPWLYFIFEMTVLECIFLYMKHTHEKVCREMTAAL